MLKLDIISAVHAITHVSSSSVSIIAKIRFGLQVIHTREEKLGSINISETGSFAWCVTGLKHVHTSLRPRRHLVFDRID